MGDSKLDASRASKRLKISHTESQQSQSESSAQGQRPLTSLSRSITPPPPRNGHNNKKCFGDVAADPRADAHQTPVIPSPVQLTHIRDIPDSSGHNNDTVKLRDILGDPLIKECWQFNFCFDVDFLMDQFDPDVKGLVQVKVVHGSWKKESPNRIRIEEACSRYRNVEQIIAYMPEPFGTHHTKMMILIRHDRVVIHTANILAQDWQNMSQAVWRSPLLPLLAENSRVHSKTDNRFGRGLRFKRDLLAYLAAYRTRKFNLLINELKNYDFSSIRAALIASVPSRQNARSATSENNTLWGWLALKDTLRNIPMRQKELAQNDKPHIVTQVSSIATLGQTDKWLKGTFFNSLCPRPDTNTAGGACTPKFSIVFPTPDEIRRSLDGYASGGSIHMKIQSAAQQKQLVYLRPHLCHWAGDTEDLSNSEPTESQTPSSYSVPKPLPIREAGRKRAAPHIKTYIRFSDSNMESIDWGMITSANLSTQAWGAAANDKGEVRICSWEVGVLFWPDLFVDNKNDCQSQADELENEKGREQNTNEEIRMVPCFRSDLPSKWETQKDEDSVSASDSQGPTTVGFRMPYNLPLRPYSAQDTPWCATASHSEPDWLGQTWEEG